ncbi:MAG: DEAD/DEAH box helicase [Paludibacteraceae bacterium]|nr:DEAD/DEAH box helicase [Paludibacteraceae bacterium]
MRFDELNLTDALLEGLQAMNFKETTPVQAQTIPLILEKKDMIACAQTGTGKTAAYLLPILNVLCKKEHPEDKINALIMVPTRELALQIDQQLDAFAYFLPVTSVAVYGGGDGAIFSQQEKAMRSGVDVVIATPGRLIALLNMGKIDMSHVQFFVLDEADRMLEMGFVDEIMRIASYLPKQKQTLLFSATMPPKIHELARKVLINPTEVHLSTSKPAEKIDQSAYICYEAQKLALIGQIFSNKQLHRVIVFSSSKQKVKEIYHTFRKMNLKVAAMHSDLEQNQREEVIRQFKNGHIHVLVATDIVARGIDIEDIQMVINYDVPHDVEDYVHRIGRTARAGGEGIAITFVAEKEQHKFSAIEKFIEKEIPKAQLPASLGEGPAYSPIRKGKPNRGKGGKKRFYKRPKKSVERTDNK